MSELQKIEQLIAKKRDELRPAGDKAREIQAEREKLEIEVLALQKEPRRLVELIEKQEEIAKLTQTLLWMRPATDAAQKEIVELGVQRDRVFEFIKAERARLAKARRSLERCQRNHNQAGILLAEKDIASAQVRLRQLG